MPDNTFWRVVADGEFSMPVYYEDEFVRFTKPQGLRVRRTDLRSDSVEYSLNIAKVESGGVIMVVNQTEIDWGAPISPFESPKYSQSVILVSDDLLPPGWKFESCELKIHATAAIRYQLSFNKNARDCCATVQVSGWGAVIDGLDTWRSMIESLTFGFPERVCGDSKVKTVSKHNAIVGSSSRLDVLGVPEAQKYLASALESIWHCGARDIEAGEVDISEVARAIRDRYSSISRSLRDVQLEVDAKALENWANLLGKSDRRVSAAAFFVAGVLRGAVHFCGDEIL